MSNPTHSPSADPDEVRRFTALADRWWDPSGPFWPLHTLNRLRSAWLAGHLAPLAAGTGTAQAPLRGLRVLDIGCGGGILAESMARLGASVTGIDIVERNVLIARRHALLSGLAIDYRATGVEPLAASGVRFDAVLNMEVVEHVTGVDPFLDACATLVRPGGAMAVATINRTPLAWLTAIVAAEYLLRWLPRGTHHWSKFPKPHEVERALVRNGLAVTARTGVGVNPLTRRMHLSRSLAVNYMLLAVRRVPAQAV
jgi:2-polyprenyl-6-hydroxyphenyl methylase/3-demethylubiquinone-9 3-methyltransferase